MTETANSIGPWTVKGIPPEDREAINAAAKRAAMPNGAWLRMIAAQAIEAERAPPLARVMEGPREDLSVRDSLAVVAQLGAVLPGVAESKRGGAVAAQIRRVMSLHLARLGLPDQGKPAGVRRLGTNKISTPEG